MTLFSQTLSLDNKMTQEEKISLLEDLFRSDVVLNIHHDRANQKIYESPEYKTNYLLCTMADMMTRSQVNQIRQQIEWKTNEKENI